MSKVPSTRSCLRAIVVVTAVQGSCSNGGVHNSVDDAALAALPSDWQTLSGSCRVAYHVPPGTTLDVQFAGSAPVCLDQLEGNGCRFSAEYERGPGLDKGSVDWQTDFTESDGQVDGHAAHFTRYQEEEPSGKFVRMVMVATPQAAVPDAYFAMSATCDSEATAAVAATTLTALTFKDAPGALAQLPAEPCDGDDARPVDGYVLGDSCVTPKHHVPGVCAVGARKNASAGTGSALCFVADDGSYYFAFVKFGASRVRRASVRRSLSAE